MYPPPTATAPPLSSVTPALPIQFCLHHSALFSQPHTFPLFFNSKRSILYRGQRSRPVLGPASASISNYSHEESERRVYDPELRRVLELATDSELYELERILFGTSYFSPLLKSVLKTDEIDHMVGEDPDEREDYISMLESRFMFLAADARSTLRGWRPSYRSVLLEVRKKLKIPCSAKLSAADLEVEIFLHLLQEYSSEEHGSISSTEITKNDRTNSLELGLSNWKVQKLAALGIGATEIRSLLLKGGGMLTLEKLLESLGWKFSGKLFTEAAKYQIVKELIKKGGQLAAFNLESRTALLVARQGLNAAAARYLGLKSVTQLFGPLMWGTLLADVVIQMLGTDYARILRAIYALAQIRILSLYR